MIDAIAAFILIGAILFIGFIGSLLFEKTITPDILLLIVVGIIMGPVTGVIPSGQLTGIIDFFSALALIMILFSGGLQLNLHKILSQLKRATYFTVASFVLTVLSVTIVAQYAFGLDSLMSLFLGVILGGTSAGITSTILSRIISSEEDRNMFALGSTLTDALSIVFAITIIQMMVVKAVDFSATLNSIASAFSVAIVLGAIVGVAWLGILRDLRVRPFGYLLTLATAFLLYGVVEVAKGNGAIAALVFGLVLGNAPQISSVLNLQGHFELDRTIKQFQSEVAFFVRTFFFVYIGLNFNLRFEWQVAAFSLLAVAAIVASRHVALRLTMRGIDKKTLKLYSVLVPRGLAAAVLSTLPLSKGIVFPNLIEVTVFVLVFTSLLSAVGVYLYAKVHPAPLAVEERLERPNRSKRPSIVQVK